MVDLFVDGIKIDIIYFLNHLKLFSDESFFTSLFLSMVNWKIEGIYLSIYYLIGVSRDTCLRSPYVDMFKKSLLLHV